MSQDAQGTAIPDAKGTAIPEKRTASGGFEWTLSLAGWILLLSVGPLFWLVNGSFSVTGLGVLAKAAGDGGILFWRYVTLWHTNFSPDVIGQQPLAPWGVVLAGSLFQVGMIAQMRKGQHIPMWAWVVGMILSAYDALSTFFGLSTIQWIQGAGVMGLIPLTFFLTFSLEIGIGFVVGKRR